MNCDVRVAVHLVGILNSLLNARRRGHVESFSIHTHEILGSTQVQVTVYLSGRIIHVFLLASYLFWKEIAPYNTPN